MENSKFFFKNISEYKYEGTINFQDLILSQEFYQRMINTKIYLHLKNVKNILFSQADAIENIPHLGQYHQVKGHPIRLDSQHSNFDMLFSSPDLYMFKYLRQFISQQFLPDQKLITHDSQIDVIVYTIPSKNKKRYYHSVNLA
eukprot:403357495